MKLIIYIASLMAIVLVVVAIVVGLGHFPETYNEKEDIKYGLYEGMELVGIPGESGRMTYVVIDADGNRLFSIPLRNCMIDVRYRCGRLHFRENATGREGYIDRQGVVTFLYTGKNALGKSGDGATIVSEQNPYLDTEMTPAPVKEKGRNMVGEVDLKSMAHSNPFYKEAARVVSGGLKEDDAHRRRVILNYCEHFRTAYTTKDIDFLRQVFSEKALIIVGNVVKTKAGNEDGYLSQDRVTYNIHSKKEYLARLGKVFAASKKVDVKFSDFHIRRHPTIDGIYGVSMRQKYISNRYTDDGYLFLLWDFRNESMPVIHVRTWQPASSVADANEVITIRDFNFE